MRRIFKIIGEKLVETDFSELKKGDKFKIVDDCENPVHEDIKNNIVRIARSDVYINSNSVESIDADVENL